MTEPEPLDAELVAAARAGSRPALERLVERYQRPVYRLCRRYLRDHDAAADLCQRAFMRALMRMGELREAEHFSSWLFRIAANLACNQLRDQARFVRTPGPEPVVSAGAHDALEAAERLEGLRRAIAQLPGRQRMVVQLRLERDLPFAGIGRLLDISENAAKTAFHHAGKALRRLLAGGQDMPGRTVGEPSRGGEKQRPMKLFNGQDGVRRQRPTAAL